LRAGAVAGREAALVVGRLTDRFGFRAVEEHRELDLVTDSECARGVARCIG
jgi:hypothetical protein